MLNPKFQLKHRKSLSLLLKQIATASFEKLKEEIKVAISAGSKVTLAFDAWARRNHTKFLGIIGSWIIEWQLKDGLLGFIPYDPATEGPLSFQAGQAYRNNQ